jgi:hypothetical protein
MHLLIVGVDILIKISRMFIENCINSIKE